MHHALCCWPPGDVPEKHNGTSRMPEAVPVSSQHSICLCWGCTLLMLFQGLPVAADLLVCFMWWHALGLCCQQSLIALHCLNKN